MTQFTNSRGILAGALWAIFQLGVVLAFVTTHTAEWNVGAITSAVLLCVGACCSGTALALKTQRPADWKITLSVGVLMALELLCSGIALAVSYIPAAVSEWDAHLPLFAVGNVIFGIAALAVVALSDDEAKIYAEHAQEKARRETDAEMAALNSPEGQAILLSKYLGKLKIDASKAAPSQAHNHPAPLPKAAEVNGNKQHSPFQ